LFLPAIYQFEAWLGGDKLMHLKLSVVLSMLACFAVSNIKKNLPLNAAWRIVFIQLFLVVCLFFDEAHQYLAPSRRFEWLDLYYGVGGLLIGLSIYCCFWGMRIACKTIPKTYLKLK
jgi:protein-S-isoprenylcysteine O-methyltransferase Ste14